MLENIRNKVKRAWNAFNSDPPSNFSNDLGIGSYYRPDRKSLRIGSEKKTVASIYNRIAMDAASIRISHARLDNNKRFLEDIKSGLNECLNVSANIDQTGRAFLQDVVMSMLDEGVVAIVPVETSNSPINGNPHDIYQLRTGKIIEWFPKHVKIEVYNEQKGKKETIKLPKSFVAIIENPFYAVMNEPNSTLKRLLRKISLLDSSDEKSNSGKLDIIFQLPYSLRSEAKKLQAEERKKDIEAQLTYSKYGIAYIDATEKITQLNRSIENNLLDQIETLTVKLYSELGLTKSIFEGNASEEEMLNYYMRTLEPILSAIVLEMTRKFLSKTARTQNQAIVFYKNPFSLVTVRDLADVADRFTRNEILSSNEVRAIMGYKPSDDPMSDKLINKNIRQNGSLYEEETEEMDISELDE